MAPESVLLMLDTLWAMRTIGDQETWTPLFVDLCSTIYACTTFPIYSPTTLCVVYGDVDEDFSGLHMASTGDASVTPPPLHMAAEYINMPTKGLHTGREDQDYYMNVSSNKISHQHSRSFSSLSSPEVNGSEREEEQLMYTSLLHNQMDYCKRSSLMWLTLCAHSVNIFGA